MTVQLGIAHDSPPFGKRVYHHLLPTENPEATLRKGDDFEITPTIAQQSTKKAEGRNPSAFNVVTEYVSLILYVALVTK